MIPPVEKFRGPVLPPPKKSNTVSITAESGTPFAHAAGRINSLRDPNTLNLLLNEFQEQGMPMGSDRWAEHCLAYLRELKERERTLRRIVHKPDELKIALEYCKSSFYRAQRQRITREWQEEKEREEKEALEQYGIEELKKGPNDKTGSY